MSIERRIRNLYVRWIRPHVPAGLAQQRLKLIWDAWGYAPLLATAAIDPKARVALVARMLVVDWNVPHAHKPRELVAVFRSISARPARAGEAVIEAGCWKGGSSAKFSLLCKMFGYRLHVYDSFEGVEARTAQEGVGGTDYSGNYAAQLELVKEHVAKFGELAVCEFHKGWFADTLVKTPPEFPVRGAYIDCDLAKGTAEVLEAVLPRLAEDGWIYTQDYHIASVRALLSSDELWSRLGRATPPRVEQVYRNLARVLA